MGATPVVSLAVDHANRRIHPPWLLTQAVIPAVATSPTKRKESMQPLSVLLALTVSAVAMATPAIGAYRLLQTIPVPGDDGWDHPTVDSAARRLYVTHGTHVAVIDIDSGKIVGKIEDTPGVHFTVIDPESNRGFVS